MATADNRGTGKDKHGGKGMRDRALELVPQQSEVDGYVIQVDGDGRDETRDIEPTRHVDEARQDEQAQSPCGQMADFVEQAGAQNAEWNRRSAASNASATPASNTGQAHNLTEPQPLDRIRPGYLALAETRGEFGQDYEEGAAVWYAAVAGAD